MKLNTRLNWIFTDWYQSINSNFHNSLCLVSPLTGPLKERKVQVNPLPVAALYWGFSPTNSQVFQSVSLSLQCWMAHWQTLICPISPLGSLPSSFPRCQWATTKWLSQLDIKTGPVVQPYNRASYINMFSLVYFLIKGTLELNKHVNKSGPCKNMAAAILLTLLERLNLRLHVAS